MKDVITRQPGRRCHSKAGPIRARRSTCGRRSSGRFDSRESAPINHGWHSTLYVTARGLTTSPIPHGHRIFQIDFDFIDHALVIEASDGRSARVPLEPQTVAVFYRRVMDALAGLDIDVRIYAKPNEVADPIPFDRDEVHRAYDARSGQPVLARARAERPGVQALSLGLPRQVQPSAPLLGRARSRRHAILRPPGAAASWWHSQPSRSRHARGLLARSQQLRVLGGRGSDCVSGLLLIRVPGTARVRGRRGRAERGVLQHRSARVHPAVRRGAHARPIPIGCCSSSCSPLT